jgi:hypothetical protein
MKICHDGGAKAASKNAFSFRESRPGRNATDGMNSPEIRRAGAIKRSYYNLEKTIKQGNFSNFPFWIVLDCSVVFHYKIPIGINLSSPFHSALSIVLHGDF